MFVVGYINLQKRRIRRFFIAGYEQQKVAVGANTASFFKDEEILIFQEIIYLESSIPL